jgi:hypothetical protein
MLAAAAGLLTECCSGCSAGCCCDAAVVRLYSYLWYMHTPVVVRFQIQQILGLWTSLTAALAAEIPHPATAACILDLVQGLLAEKPLIHTS